MENGTVRKFPDLLLVEGGDAAGAQALMHGLQDDVGGSEGKVDGIGKLPVGHAVVDVGRADGNDDGGLPHVFLAERRFHHLLPGLFFLDDDEAPCLPVFCRRGKARSFQDPLDLVFFYRLGSEGPYAPPSEDLGHDFHGCEPDYTNSCRFCKVDGSRCRRCARRCVREVSLRLTLPCASPMLAVACVASGGSSSSSRPPPRHSFPRTSRMQGSRQPRATLQ